MKKPPPTSYLFSAGEGPFSIGRSVLFFSFEARSSPSRELHLQNFYAAPAQGGRDVPALGTNGTFILSPATAGHFVTLDLRVLPCQAS